MLDEAGSAILTRSFSNRTDPFLEPADMDCRRMNKIRSSRNPLVLILHHNEGIPKKIGRNLWALPP